MKTDDLGPTSTKEASLSNGLGNGQRPGKTVTS